MDRPLPQAGELWQHFKGNKYWIIGESYLLTKTENIYGIIYVSSLIKVLEQIAENSFFIIQDSETENYYLVEWRDNQWILYYYSEPHTLESVGWVRPLPMFMEILSDNNQEQSSKYYRFTKIDI